MLALSLKQYLDITLQNLADLVLLPEILIYLYIDGRLWILLVVQLLKDFMDFMENLLEDQNLTFLNFHLFIVLLLLLLFF